MKKKKFFNSLVFKLILGIIIGIIVGNISNVTAIRIIDSIKRVIGSLIGYIVPLIILGFITPAIVSLKENAGKVLGVTLIICYASSVGAATMSFLAGKAIIPNLNIASSFNRSNYASYDSTCNFNFIWYCSYSYRIKYLGEFAFRIK